MLENQCTVCTPNLSFLIYLLCPRWLADAHLLPAWEDQASLNAILRKTGLSPTALYDRLAFIHRRTIAFETSRFGSSRTPSGSIGSTSPWRLRLLGIDTKTDHCAHGFRTTFSTLSHHEEIKDVKAWDGDVVELQLAHLDNSTVYALFGKIGRCQRETGSFHRHAEPWTPMRSPILHAWAFLPHDPMEHKNRRLFAGFSR